MVRGMGAAAVRKKDWPSAPCLRAERSQPGCIPAREYRILSTGLVSRGIFIVPVSRRHGTLILFDTSPHFSQQVIPKINIIIRPGSRMFVLCFQVSSNFGSSLTGSRITSCQFLSATRHSHRFDSAVLSKYLRAFLGNWWLHIT